MRPRTKTVNPGRVSVAVAELRKLLKLTQQEFAQVLGTSITTINRYETGRIPDGEILVRLRDLAAEHLRRDPDNDELELVENVFYSALVNRYPAYRAALAHYLTLQASRVIEGLTSLIADENPTVSSEVREYLKGMLEPILEIEKVATLLDPGATQMTLREYRRFDPQKLSRLVDKTLARFATEEARRKVPSESAHEGSKVPKT